MKRLDNRVALVTGAASGIGKATAWRLAQEGAAVVVTDISDAAGEAVAEAIRREGGKALFVHHDVTAERDWANAIERTAAAFGGLDVLVNNAGVGDLGSIEETSYEAYKKTVAITQDSVFLGIKAAAKLLMASGQKKRASIINISSIFGASGGFGTSPGYHAAKGAVRILTKNVALHWAQQGVRVNSVHPGFIDTPILAPTKGTPFEKTMVDLTPMGRLGKPEEIAATVAFLASDDAAFVTGSELYVDGGYLAR
jgi:NAD(P)-dependent dehydrogenase (short-subunit alcohol dehydrogenase family)